MKAIVCNEYGTPEVLRLKDVAKPTPKDNEILIRNRATSVNFGDTLARNFKGATAKNFNMPFMIWLFAKLYFGWSKPRIKIFGSEFAGEVEAVGANVKSFKPGDQVFGYLGQNMGAYSEYICMPASGCVALKPNNMSFDEAAVIPYGAIMALNLLVRLNILPGQKILIIGASGAIGSAAVQIANYLGAEVTGVCSTNRLEYVKMLGAKNVIDYTKEDFTRNGQVYDIIFDVLGKSSISKCKSSLTHNGRFLFASFKMGKLFQMFWTSIAGGKKVICAMAPGSVEDLYSVKKLIEDGKIKSLIDKRFSLEETAEAHKYVESGQKKGNVVITVNQIN